MTPSHGVHDYVDDPRNAEILVSVNGVLVPRAQAVVSVFDAGFVLGDGVWEGLRVAGGHPAFLEQHLDRLFEGAAALALDVGLTREEVTAELYRTLAANGMTGDGVHVRLMVTRGPKTTPYQDPRLSAGPATVVIVAEHKTPLDNVLLIRDPGEVVGSYLARRECVSAADLGVFQQAELHDMLAIAPVIDSADFLRQPELYLRWLCDHVGVDFTPAMLPWPAGRRDTDGVWAEHWYGEVMASTGFVAYRRPVELPPETLEIVEQVRPCYDMLHAARLRL